VQSLLKEAASRDGFDQNDFTSHSLRAGGASAMYHNGFTVEEIQRRGRWASDVWKIYIQGISVEAAEMTKRMSKNSTVLPERLKAWA
jgi:integrase